MDQLAEYRARHKQRWCEAEQLQQEDVAAQVDHRAVPTTPPRQESSRMRAARPCSLVVDQMPAEGESRMSLHDKCPGTPVEYRERHKRRFAACKLGGDLKIELPGQEDSTCEDVGSLSTTAGSSLLGEVAADLQAESSCPGTPREYRDRQQHRFAIAQQQCTLDLGSSTFATSSTAADGSNVEGRQDLSSIAALVERGTASSVSSPPTPRLRGSASLRAISAARAMRMEAASPLPGAAWPGHSQRAGSVQQPVSVVSIEQASGYGEQAQGRPRSTGRSPPAEASGYAGQAQVRPRSTSRSPPALPPRPPMLSKMSSPDVQRSNERRSCGLPPRPRTPSRRAETFSSCPSRCAAEGTDDRNLNLSILCH